MRLKKILSTALVFVMLFASMVAAIPVSAFASSGSAFSVDVDLNTPTTEYSAEEVLKICNDYLKYGTRFTDKDEVDVPAFTTAQQMLDYEDSKGYLAKASSGNFELYVNRYTGFAYYKNIVTGQILTSNPIDPAYQTVEGSNKIQHVSAEVLSQLHINYNELTSSEADKEYYSLEWIMEGCLLAISQIEGQGISVEYTLGEDMNKFSAPRAILQDTFKEDLLDPILQNYAALLQEYCGDWSNTVVNSVYTNKSNLNKLGGYDISTRNDIFWEDGSYKFSSILTYAKSLRSYAEAAFELGKINRTQYDALAQYCSGIETLLSTYEAINPEDSTIASSIDFEVANALKEGKIVVFMKTALNAEIFEINNLRNADKAIRELTNKSYTHAMAEAAEEECGYASSEFNIPSFKISLNYKLNEDGSLSVDLPADQIIFDRSVYKLTSLSPLKYFGNADLNEEGYAFFPDGSGSVIKFDDVYFGTDGGRVNSTVTVKSDIYGDDYCYADITKTTSGAHREQVTMPVYGMVSTVNSTAGKIKNGFFAIMESGSSSAQINFKTGGSSHKYGYSYTMLEPIPYDTYDLSKSISVSGLSEYTVVVKKGYEGTYSTKYFMLTDPTVAASTGYLTNDEYYTTTYVGMASCYREYLEESGMISAITDAANQLPLYIEALGSIDVTKKILTFPVTVSTSLTKFEHVKEMYDKFSTDGGIKNINFKLTGFANGGMYFTYPAKVNWESSVGGKNGFKDLVATAKNTSGQVGYNFGIYPDFDFAFINNTAAFDGVSKNGTAAKMVDNRYASKQVYDAVAQSYESLFSLVVSPNAFDGLYDKFYSKYSKFDIDTLSVATLGSVLNSNFDEDNTVNREESIGYITALLEKMTDENKGNYSLMTDTGNIYTVKYVDHILNATIDSSHIRYSSYTVPFFGLVLHGYVSYAGSPLNYSGSPDYDILRAIENGASLYYILCYENTNHLKEDPLLSKYYGISYHNWYDLIVEQYDVLNTAIGNLQTHKITDHSIIFAERVMDKEEKDADYIRLIDEFAATLDLAISSKIDAKIKDMRDNNVAGGVKAVINHASILERVGAILELDDEQIEALVVSIAIENSIKNSIVAAKAQYPATDSSDNIAFTAEDIYSQEPITVNNIANVVNASIAKKLQDADTLNAEKNVSAVIDEAAIIDAVYSLLGLDGIAIASRDTVESVMKKYEVQYPNTNSVAVDFASEDVVYESRYSYYTDSVCTDSNYKLTDYTCDNGSVVMVTYEKAGEKTVFLLNYNVFSVKIKLDASVHYNFAEYADEDGFITLDSYGYVKIQ